MCGDCTKFYMDNREFIYHKIQAYKSHQAPIHKMKLCRTDIHKHTNLSTNATQKFKTEYIRTI